MNKLPSAGVSWIWKLFAVLTLGFLAFCAAFFGCAIAVACVARVYENEDIPLMMLLALSAFGLLALCVLGIRKLIR